MDYDKLLEPYSENNRTIGAQIKWLLKNGFPQTSVDYAMSAVYKRLESGETFKDGHELDQELRRVANKHYTQDIEMQMKQRIGEVEKNLDYEWNKLGKVKKIWEVIRGKA